MRLLVVVAPLVVVGSVAIAIGACDDSAHGGSGAGDDGGSEATIYPAPSLLDCTQTTIPDPCAGVRTEASSYALTPFPPPDAGVEGGTTTDGGAAEAGTIACAPTGTTKIRCPDGNGDLSFDLVARPGKITDVLAASNIGRLLSIAADGTMTLGNEANVSGSGGRLVVGASGVRRWASVGTPDKLTVHTEGGSVVYANVETTIANDTPYGGAAILPDDTVLVTVQGASKSVLATITPGATEAALVDAPYAKSVFGIDSNGGKLFAGGAGGIGVTTPTRKDTIPANRVPIAIVAGKTGPVIVYPDYDSFGLFVGTTEGGYSQVVVPGGGSTCPEHACSGTCDGDGTIVPQGAVALVSTTRGVYVVAMKALVTEHRSYHVDSDLECDLFGPCPCVADVTISAVKDTWIEILALDDANLVETMRARVPFDPKNVVTTRGRRPLVATERDGVLHVGVVGSDQTLTRLLFDLP